jgi:hypothetical protein
MDTLSVFFLAQDEQPADAVMARLTGFIRAASQTLDFALYDMRLSAPLRAQLVAALRERAEAGVQIRFCPVLTRLRPGDRYRDRPSCSRRPAPRPHLQSPD